MNAIRRAAAAIAQPSVAALLGSAIVLNLVGGEAVKLARLPIYGDSVGTMLVGMLCGPLVGAVGGALSNVVLGLRDPAMPYFAPVSVVIGALAGLAVRAGLVRAWRGDDVRRAPLRALGGPVVAGLVTGVAAAVVATPIATYVFGGLTGGPTDILVGVFRAFGADLWKSVLGQSVVSDPVDKTATALLALAIASALPRRAVARFPQGERLLGAPAAGPGAAEAVDALDR